MKKRVLAILLALTMMVGLLPTAIFAANTPVSLTPAAGRDADSKSATIDVNGTVTVTITNTKPGENGENFLVEIKEPTDVASVNPSTLHIDKNGTGDFTVTGLKAGTTTITFKSGHEEATLKLTVNAAPAHTHTLTPVEAKPATCSAEGKKEHYKCDNCNKLFEDKDGNTPATDLTIPIDKDAHTLTHVAATAPTATLPGNNEYWKCSGCDKIFSDADGQNDTTAIAVVINPTGTDPDHQHKLTKVEAKAATETEAGNDEYYTCSDCGKLFKDENGQTETTLADVTKAATGKHNIEKIAAKAPTCTEPGHEEYYYCNDCHKFFTDEKGQNEVKYKDKEIPATGHDLTKVPAKEPTRTEPGNKEYYVCKGCEKLFADAEGKDETTLAAVTVPATGKITFIDVPDNAYYRDAVYWAVDQGVTTGISSTLFNPNGICTRAEAVTFLWRAAGCPAPDSTAMPFKDVPANSWYYTAVLWAVGEGITTGTDATTFSPNMTCSRAQIVTLQWRASGSPSVGTVSQFADVGNNEWFTKAVNWAVNKGITNGTAPTTFSPNQNCSRAEIVTFLYRNAVK